jgi:hypothetical protein
VLRVARAWTGAPAHDFKSEAIMGQKSSHFFQANRPESGGANKDEQFEKSGLLDREKEKLGAARQDATTPEREEPERPRERQPKPEELDQDERSDDRDPGHS